MLPSRIHPPIPRKSPYPPALKHLRYHWNCDSKDRKSAMADTICIAAICGSPALCVNPGEESTIILCSDSRLELEGVATGHTLKLFLASPSWIGLLAGDVSKAKELISRYSQCLEEAEKGSLFNTVHGALD